MKAPATLVILDSHAILHRAYHGMPDFTTRSGEPTGALYGLCTMILRVLKQFKPDYIVATFDLPQPTYRHTMYQEYKGTRSETEQALREQIQKSKEVFEALGIPVLEAPGFEADDCIGTIVEQLKERTDIHIVIASGDHDTMQLVAGTQVEVFTLRKGMTDTVLYDEAAVRTRYGFGPEHITDYKALRGDTSDNIVGIKGIGEKTATILIQTFGTIENLYNVLKSTPEKMKGVVTPRIAQLLVEGEDSAFFSKVLATIRRDAPITYTVPTESFITSLDTVRAAALCEKYEFNSLVPRFKNLKNQIEQSIEEDVLPAIEEVLVEVSSEELAELSVMTWLLDSDTTAPSLDDVLRYARTTSPHIARTKLEQELKNTGRLWEVFITIEKPLIPVLLKMHTQGIGLDVAYLKTLSSEYHLELGVLTQSIYRDAGHEFNINSPKQLGTVLFEEMQLGTGKGKKTTTGQRSTREEELEKLRDEHAIVHKILRYREKQKLVSTYIDALPTLVGTDGRLHTTFLQAGTTTGRMASHNPNMQNIPVKTEESKRIRNAFVAGKGKVLVSLDYSQIELRIAAAISKDEKLIESFKSGADIHATVAVEVFGVGRSEVTADMRRRAKVINFGILYGMGVNALKGNLGDGATTAESKAFLERYFFAFPKLADYIETTKAQVREQGYTETLFGRRRVFKNMSRMPIFMQAQVERMAVNAPIQGTQADIIKLAMIAIDSELQTSGLEKKAQLLLQIHDELVFEVDVDAVPELIKLARMCMENAASSELLQGVPITVGVAQGASWGELEK
jgi:DNA polymerase I